MDPQRSFLAIEPLEFEVADWNAGDKCLTCDFHKSLTALNSSMVPQWYDGLTTTCMDCTLANSPVSVQAAAAELAGAPQPTAGRGGAAAAGGGSGGEKSLADSVMDNPTYLGLTIAGVIVVVALLAVGGFFAFRACRGRTTSATELGKIARETGGTGAGFSTELTANPAVTSDQRW